MDRTLKTRTEILSKKTSQHGHLQREHGVLTYGLTTQRTYPHVASAREPQGITTTHSLAHKTCGELDAHITFDANRMTVARALAYLPKSCGFKVEAAHTERWSETCHGEGLEKGPKIGRPKSARG